MQHLLASAVSMKVLLLLGINKFGKYGEKVGLRVRSPVYT